MNARRGIVVALVAFAVALAVQPAGVAQEKEASRERIKALVAGLGGEEIEDRVKAEAQLKALGLRALDELQIAAQSSDVEVRRRARRLVAGIELETTRAALLAPKKVKLTLKDVPLSEAFRELEKASGYRIDLGKGVSTADRKVTLTTGEVTFVEALDALCEKAKLVQGRPPVPIGKGSVADGKRVAGPIQPEKPVPDMIVLEDGTPSRGPVVHAGTLRVRATGVKGGKTGELTLSLEASAEPRLREFRVVGVQEITKAADDQGQTLALLGSARPPSKNRGSISINGRTITPPTPAWDDRVVNLSLKKGAKDPKLVRELSGVLLVSAIQEIGPLASLADVADAKGRTALGRDGYSMKVEAVEAKENGDVRLTVNVSQPLAEDPAAAATARMLRGGKVAFGGNVVINGWRLGDNPTANLPPPYPRLLDEKGQAWTLAAVTDQTLTAGKERRDSTFTLLYRPPGRGAKAAKLSLYATEVVVVSVPFTLKDVPLP